MGKLLNIFNINYLSVLKTSVNSASSLPAEATWHRVKYPGSTPNHAKACIPWTF
jgi:hypothetical protein